MPSLEDVQKTFSEEVRYVDDVAQVILKGHLVLEDLMTQSLEAFMLHGEFVGVARLSFSQKLTLCRGISTSDQNNNMWNLVGRINALRNALAHSLNADRRSKAVQDLRSVYVQEFNEPQVLEGVISPEMSLCLSAVSVCLGYAHAHLEEVKRLKSLIMALDQAYNKGAIAKST